MISNPKAYAHLAGVAYLGIFVLAIFANFFVLEALITPNDPAATVAAISEQEPLFRLGVAALFLVLILDVLVAWSLFYVMAPVSLPLAALSSVFHLAYTISHIGVLLNLAKVVELIGRPEVYEAIDGVSAGAWHYFYLAGHQGEFALTLIFFGVHLLVLGFLVVRAPFLPAVIGVLVAIAGAGYVVDGFASILWDGYGPLGNIGLYVVILPALIGEGALMLWLLLRGLNREKWLACAA